MVDERERNRENDTRLLTPLLLMALMIACGALLYAFAGHVPTAQG
jgi:hypothetical protein